MRRSLTDIATLPKKGLFFMSLRYGLLQYARSARNALSNWKEGTD